MIIAPANKWLEPCPTAEEQDDRTFWLDHGRRSFRLRAAGPVIVAAVRRDGVIHVTPDDEILGVQSESFASKIFGIWEDFESAAKPKPRRTLFVRLFASRRVNAAT